MVTYHIELTRDDLARDLRNLAEGFDVQIALEAAANITALYVESQAIVHVETGKLKATGSIGFQTDKYTIDSSLAYGGPTRESGYYAVYEKARKAPTAHAEPPHDYLIGTRDPVLEEGYKKMVIAWLKRATNS